MVGHKLPAFQVRDLVKEFDTNIKDGRIDIEEFKMVSIVSYPATSCCLQDINASVYG